MKEKWLKYLNCLKWLKRCGSGRLLFVLLIPLMMEICLVPFIGTGEANNLSIIGAEYFIDQDPGEGNGISLSPVDGDFDGQEE